MAKKVLWWCTERGDKQVGNVRILNRCEFTTYEPHKAEEHSRRYSHHVMNFFGDHYGLMELDRQRENKDLRDSDSSSRN